MLLLLRVIGKKHFLSIGPWKLNQRKEDQRVPTAGIYFEDEIIVRQCVCQTFLYKTREDEREISENIIIIYGEGFFLSKPHKKITLSQLFGPFSTTFLKKTKEKYIKQEKTSEAFVP